MIKVLITLSIIVSGILGYKTGTYLTKRTYDKDWVVCKYEHYNTYIDPKMKHKVMEFYHHVPRKFCSDQPNDSHSVIYSKRTIMDFDKMWDEDGTLSLITSDGRVIKGKNIDIQ